MAYRADMSTLLSTRRHRCAGTVWTVELDGRGVGECAFDAVRAARIGPPTPVPPSEVLRGRLARDLARNDRRRGLRWVWLSPSADPFTPAWPELAAPALELASDLVNRGLGVTLRTRGGLAQAGGLVTLARRHPGMLRVEIGFFSGDPLLARAWERGVATVPERLGLAAELVRAGVEVVGRLGPIVPLENDAERPLAVLVRDLVRVGVHTVAPDWIEDGVGLVKQVEREVSRSRGRMLHGWFHMEPEDRYDEPGRLPERVRRHVLGRLQAAADAAGAQLVVCACTSHYGAGQCLAGPRGALARRQLDLFAESA